MILRRLPVALAYLTLSLGLHAGLAPTAAEVAPLPVGASVPDVVLQTIDGTDVGLAAALGRQPTIVIFYRGSWCPYCNRHLAALAEMEPQLLKMGYQILAISPDEVAGLRAMTEKNHLGYRLLSDRLMRAASAFGVAFRVDEKTTQAYAGHGVALAPVPGEAGGRWLPVPAVYVIGGDGTVKFVHADADYKVRLSGEAVLAAARAAL